MKILRVLVAAAALAVPASAFAGGYNVPEKEMVVEPVAPTTSGGLGVTGIAIAAGLAVLALAAAGSSSSGSD